jgi:hypothetical protein
MHKAYLVYGLLVLALLGFGEYRGWSLLVVQAANEGPVPESIRDNPGAYRAQYVRNTRYVGGK